MIKVILLLEIAGLFFDEIPLDFDDQLDKVILECRNLSFLHFDCFCILTLIYRYPIAWLSEEIDMIFYISDFIARMSKQKKPPVSG